MKQSLREKEIASLPTAPRNDRALPVFKHTLKRKPCPSSGSVAEGQSRIVLSLFCVGQTASEYGIRCFVYDCELFSLRERFEIVIYPSSKRSLR